MVYLFITFTTITRDTVLLKHIGNSFSEQSVVERFSQTNDIMLAFKVNVTLYVILLTLQMLFSSGSPTTEKGGSCSRRKMSSSVCQQYFLNLIVQQSPQ